MKNRCLSLLIIGLTLIGCKKQENLKVDETSTKITNDVSKKDTIGIVDKVEEGVLTYQLSFKDSIVDGFVKYISKEPLLANELIEEYSEKLTESDRAHLKNILKNNPRFNVMFGSLPFLKNSIYIAGYEVVYKGQGLSYTIENKWNDILDEGYGFAESRIVPNSSLNFKYKKEFLDSQTLQVNITEDKFDRQDTGETVVVAGYQANKIIYTHKPSTLDGERVLPLSVVAYVSKAFNPVINKVMPFYVNESAGVLKLEIQMTNTADLNLIYEANTAVERKVLEPETSILTGTTLYEVKDSRDVIALGMQLSKLIIAPRM
ncbi:hypothetical protein [Myroides marinus]|uniref:Lipoprotein n=1 Tax=Myroides marinus TaxID=703342 RepID=A0A161UBU7_9FLAO|nr:hypothetical protein [Myroides marinus]KZE83913.1 hypothetical protein AV926_03135 [Myroides marinus]MDM1370643.1 hypothetical protein [Myroides marinus]